MYFVYISECTNLLLPLPTFIPTRSALPDPAAMVGRMSSADFIIVAPSIHTYASIDLHVPLAPILNDRKETPVAGGSGPTSTVFCNHFALGKMVVTGVKAEDDSGLASRKYAHVGQNLGFDAQFLEF